MGSDWKYGTKQVLDEDLTAGEMVVIPSLGAAFLIRRIIAGGPTGRLAVLAWRLREDEHRRPIDDLAILLRRGTARECLRTPQEAAAAQLHTRPTSKTAGTSQPVPGDTLPLAG